MIRPTIQTLLSALFIAGAPFIFIFGPPSVRLSQNHQDALAVLALGIGFWFAAGLWGAYPDWRKPWLVLTGALLLGVFVMFLAVFSGPIIR